MSVVLFVLLLALAGAGLVTAGIYLVIGAGYALIICGVLFIVASLILRSGLKPNG